jgi:hypothetical protein
METLVSRVRLAGSYFFESGCVRLLGSILLVCLRLCSYWDAAGFMYELQIREQAPDNSAVWFMGLQSVRDIGTLTAKR